MKKSFSIKNFSMAVLCSLSLVLSSCASLKGWKPTTCDKEECKQGEVEPTSDVLFGVGMMLLLGSMGAYMIKCTDREDGCK